MGCGQARARGPPVRRPPRFQLAATSSSSSSLLRSTGKLGPRFKPEPCAAAHPRAVRTTTKGPSSYGTWARCPCEPGHTPCDARYMPQRHDTETPAAGPAGRLGQARTSALADPAVPMAACCCPARPMFKVVMPPTASRPHKVELWLCGHHCRVSRTALAAAGAQVYPLADGTDWAVPAGEPVGVSH